MGPGYFPILLGIVLGLLGLLLVARAVTKGDEALSALSIRPLLFLVIAVVAFGVTIQPLGLILSLLLTLSIAALASRETRPLETSILAIGLAALSVGVFHYALQLPLPILPSFMTAG
jgi:predicted membrane channel-forming protein YqfA (hemolysin III family)